MKKFKLCILADPLDSQNAGIFRATYGIVQALHRHLSDIDVILIRRKDDGQFSRFTTYCYPKLDWVPGYRLLKYFVINPFLARKYKVDFVFEPAHFGPFNLPTRIKRITFIHDLTPIIYPQYHNFWSSALQKLLLPRILRKSHLVLANSESTKRDLERIYPFTKDKIQKIDFGVPEFSLGKLDGNEESTLSTKPIFLFVGTIEPRKNLETLLEAFRIYKESEQDDSELLIIGKNGWKSDNFFSKLDRHSYKEDIKQLGFVSDLELKKYYSECKFFIYPSFYEGFGFPVLEALLHGASCIIANNSSLSEFQSKSIIFFDTENPADLAQKMKEFPLNPSLIEIDDLKAQYSWEKFTKTFKGALLYLK